LRPAGIPPSGDRPSYRGRAPLAGVRPYRRGSGTIRRGQAPAWGQAPLIGDGYFSPGTDPCHHCEVRGAEAIRYGDYPTRKDREPQSVQIKQDEHG
jgi:hypothetical protein